MDFSTLQLTYQADYAIVQFNRGKVNALNHQMVQEIRQVVQELATNDAVRGVIFAGQPHVFSAGLDVIELYGYDKAKMSAFFHDFGGMFMDLFKFPKINISAITGHSPAGGCVIAITSDYRVMADGEKYKIGLNEVAVNVLITPTIAFAYSVWLGQKKAYQYLLEGKLVSAAQAKQDGLVDEICPLEQVLEQAEAQMKRYLKADATILKATKQQLRKTWIAELERESLEEMMEATVDMWWQPTTRANMKAFIDYLANRNKK